MNLAKLLVPTKNSIFRGSLFPIVFCLAGTAIASSVTVNPDETHQTIRGFGGMVHNIWQGGKGLSAEDAKIAFGTGDGELGLSALRIPVNENSSDWGRDLEAAKLAKSYGAIVYASPWKPPTSLQTAYSFNRWGTTYNSTQIVEGNWQAYVNHLNDFAAYMKNQGVPLYAISIQNEPDWCDSWTCWTADNLYKFTKNYAGELRKNGTKVISAESFAYGKSLYDKILNDADALKNLDIVGAHFYGSNASTANSYFEYALADQKATAQERWMTEHYTESQGSGNMWRGVITTGDQDQAAKRDTVRALDVGYEIHRAFAVGNFNLYTWWYIRRCYGLIMEKDFGGKLSISQSEIGKPSKRGYVLSQFSRFVRPGAVRIGATSNPEANVFVSAYKNRDSLVVVLINRDFRASKNVEIFIAGSASVSSFKKYVTSETKNVKEEDAVLPGDGKFSVSLDRESITTLVGTTSIETPVPQRPFEGTPYAVPGKIEAEHFDIPGVGAGNESYHVASTGKGNADYRKDESVNIYKKGTGYAIGYNNEGNWYEYTVNVAETGIYTMFAAVAAAGSTSSFKLSVDGEDITENISVPKASFGEENYDDFNKVKANVRLDRGTHILRLTVTGAWFDIDYINLEAGENAEDSSPIQKEETTAVTNVLRMNAQTFEDYDIFDMQGVFMGRLGACSIQDAVSLVNSGNVLKTSGFYFVRNRNTGKSHMFRFAR